MARPRSDIAERIQRAAREQFLAQGVDGASLRAIASEAETNIGMIYYYFPTKDDLFFAVVESTYRGLLEDVSQALAAEEKSGETVPVEERLRRVYTRIWRESDDEFAVIRLVLREVMVSAERVRRLGALFAQGHIPLLYGTLHDGIDAGELRDDLPPLAMAVASMALGVVPMLAWRVAGEKLLPELPLPRPDELGQLFANILLRGIGAPGGNIAGPRTISTVRRKPVAKPAKQRKSAPRAVKRTPVRQRTLAPRRRR